MINPYTRLHSIHNLELKVSEVCWDFILNPGYTGMSGRCFVISTWAEQITSRSWFITPLLCTFE
jgi:hypothetical protein